MRPVLTHPDQLKELLGIPFNREQMLAIGAPLEPAVIVAGAGSGKTTVMAARVVWLVERHHQNGLLGGLPLAAAVPTALIGLCWLLTIDWMIFERRKGGSR